VRRAALQEANRHRTRCVAPHCAELMLGDWVRHRSYEPCVRLSFPALRPDGERVTTIIVPARTMAGIDSSELLEDEALNYFASGESVAPTATKTVTTGREHRC
jgi:hypothetical protein